MTHTTLIGLSQEEIDRVRADYDHEYFQLEEITRHYSARIRRRANRRKLLFKLLNRACNYVKHMRLLKKIEELDGHDYLDRKRLDACLDRLSDLGTRFLAMAEEWRLKNEQQKSERN